MDKRKEKMERGWVIYRTKRNGKERRNKGDEGNKKINSKTKESKVKREHRFRMPGEQEGWKRSDDRSKWRRSDKEDEA